MARIKIKDIQKDIKISRDEMRQVFGGINLAHQALVTAAECTTENISDANDAEKFASDLANVVRQGSRTVDEALYMTDGISMKLENPRTYITKK